MKCNLNCAILMGKIAQFRLSIFKKERVMKRLFKEILLLVTIISVILCVNNSVLAQTTGKIAGKVTDLSSEEPLMGANIIIEGTSIGTAAGLDGEFFILNIPPGIYNIKIQMMGYETMLFENTKVSVNRTTNLAIKMKQAIIEGQVIVVQANKTAIKKDQTSSIRNVSAEQIEMLPVEDLSAIVSMQAGVVNNHFRGGRLTEVSA